ncbi:acetyl-CoA carboxylase carboxyltransferase subunit beta [Levilactobacillus brevis]|uniref:acetyl-CoA carboxylase carboxyltransferase subunit beta n=1 Tax=Levilactobacillus brevis TaxID=1580 RepID=UPI0022E0F076|nr:acetyl-CoA carboxylase carboxyltransferase subunit beta [Levilactobacillus brevis]
MLPAKFKTPSQKSLNRRMASIPDGLVRRCPVCHTTFLTDHWEPTRLCPACGYGFRLTAMQRIKLTMDTFQETNAQLTVPDRYTDATYQAKIARGRQLTGLNESVLTGFGTIDHQSTAIGVMDVFFVMGSLGTATGEKITRLFDEATAKQLPVILFTASGGARMQEGIHSLMQMAKVSAAVARHSQAGLLYIVVLCDPTTGGVTASFAMQGDLILAEPHALVGFAGRRVIEQTIHQTPPADFQRAETVLQHGFIDAIVARPQLKQRLADLLRLHKGES